MPFSAQPEWLPLALYAVAAAVVLTLLFRIPRVGAVLRGAISFAVLAFALFVLFQQAPLHPGLSGLMDKAGLNPQRIDGDTVRLAMSPDGHFWAEVDINGVRRRMLVDSGATVTTISEETARAASVNGDDLLPVILRTSGGTIAARTGEVDRLALGTIEARNLKVVVAPTPGGMDVIGMNFLSGLASWRVEGRTLGLAPNAPAAPAATERTAGSAAPPKGS